tara:strand:- start:952 stop:1062 length:111 start_codon:yes stop_codon:yes gene_type:complete
MESNPYQSKNEFAKREEQPTALAVYVEPCQEIEVRQ